MKYITNLVVAFVAIVFTSNVNAGSLRRFPVVPAAFDTTLLEYIVEDDSNHPGNEYNLQLIENEPLFPRFNREWDTLHFPVSSDYHDRPNSACKIIRIRIKPDRANRRASFGETDFHNGETPTEIQPWNKVAGTASVGIYVTKVRFGDTWCALRADINFNRPQGEEVEVKAVWGLNSDWDNPGEILDDFRLTRVPGDPNNEFLLPSLGKPETEQYNGSTHITLIIRSVLPDQYIIEQSTDMLTWTIAPTPALIDPLIAYDDDGDPWEVGQAILFPKIAEDRFYRLRKAQ